MSHASKPDRLLSTVGSGLHRAHHLRCIPHDIAGDHLRARRASRDRKRLSYALFANAFARTSMTDFGAARSIFDNLSCRVSLLGIGAGSRGFELTSVRCRVLFNERDEAFFFSDRAMRHAARDHV